MNQANSVSSRVASCSCGQLSVIVRADPIRISICHCLACQRRTGSVFGAQARFPADAVEVKGQSQEYVRIGDEGYRIAFRLCPHCGATVYYRIGGLDAVIVPIGAFADPDFPAPTVSVYERRKHAWVDVPVRMEHLP